MSSSATKLIGSRIKALRVARKLTQEDLAEKSDLNPKYISGIEVGKQNTTVDTLEKIAKALGVELSDIVTAGHEETNVKKLQKLINDDIKSATPEQLKTIAKLIRAILR